MPIAEIVGPSGRVHYRRPVGDPLCVEAEQRPGYSVRVVETPTEERACHTCDGVGVIETENNGPIANCPVCGGRGWHAV